MFERLRARLNLLNKVRHIHVVTEIKNNYYIHTYAYRDFDSAHDCMAARCVLVQHELQDQGYYDATIDIKSDNHAIVHWNKGKNSYSYAILKSLLK
ncbi:MAG: hypothetical protein IKZ89_01155 [Bacteroidaceae bacterium]|nr:hypothetical protein [Bacteroidaceae bacterium]